MEINNCINCNSELSGEYCPDCGQRSTIERITTKSLFSNYIGRIFGFDTKFLRTVKDLTISPGKVGRTFIEGNRVRYIDPVGYFFIISTLMLLAFALLDVDIKEFMFSNASEVSQMSGQEPMTGKGHQVQQYMLQLLSENIRIMGFMIIPFIGILGKLLYRKSGLNFLEHTINAFYIQGHSTILSIIAIFFYRITDININIYVALIFIPYYAWATKTFYKKKGFRHWMKGILHYLLAYLFFMLAMSAATVMAFVVYSKYINPEFFN
jgi:hypothetical protein